MKNSKSKPSVYRAAGLAIAGAMSFASAAAAQQTLVVNSYGAEYEPIIMERIIKPFEAEFGVKVIYDVNGSASEDYARIRTTNGAPGFDVVVMTASESIARCKEGLLAPLTVDLVPNMAHLSPKVQGAWVNVVPCMKCNICRCFIAMIWCKRRPPVGQLWQIQS